MATYSTNEFKSGLKVMLDGDPCSILENEFVKPGKGQAFNRVRVRNLKTGRTVEKTWKSGDSVEAADVVDGSHSYWALHHPAALPDFHHRDGFTLELAPPHRSARRIG